MYLRRSLLNVPGHDSRKLQKSLLTKADTIVLDLEDGVPLEKKPAARQNIAQFLSEYVTSASRQEIAIRINGLSTDFSSMDLEALGPYMHRCGSIIFPKVAAALDSQKINRLLKGSTCQAFVCIESPRGLIELGSIMKEMVNLAGLIFGCEDYCATAGIMRTRGLRELLYARSTLVNYAKAYRVPAIDMVCIDFRDNEILQEEAEDGYRMGFTGKQVIHPDQIDLVNKVFSPSPEKILRAQRILALYEENSTKGRGAFDFEGTVVDLPVVEQARGLLAMQDAIKSSLNESGL